MFDIDKWQEIYSTVKRHKLRTALTAFGVFWGIFMLVVLLGAGNGFQNGIMSTLDIAENTVFVWTERTSLPYNGFQAGKSIRLTNADVLAIRTNIPEVDLIAPRNQLEGEFIVNRNEKNGSFNVFGDYPDLFKVMVVNLSSGRFINEIDIIEKRKVAVIGEGVREILFNEEEDPVGQYFKIKGVFFKVIGVFSSKKKGEEALQDLQTIYIPNTTMQYTFDQVNRIGWFAFTPKEGISSAIIETKIKGLLAARHNVAPTDDKAFGSANIEEEFNKVNGLFAGIKGFAWIVSIGTIIAGAIGVGNIMLIIVNERNKEFALRKAIGAKPLAIISSVIQESLVITGVAGYFGLLLGVVLIEGINYLLKKFDAEGQFFANPEIDFQIAISAIIVLMLAGTIAGLIPAIKASKINPARILNNEN